MEVRSIRFGAETGRGGRVIILRELRAGSNWHIVEAEDIRNETELDVDPCPVRVYNVERVIWKGITKAQLIQYYHSITSTEVTIEKRGTKLYLDLNQKITPIQ